MKTSIKITAIVTAFLTISCLPKKTESPIIAMSNAVTSKVITTDSSATSVEKRSIVFITGHDKGDKTYYKDAKAYFENQVVEIVEEAYSIQEMILWLNINYNDKPYSEIHIVSNNKWTEMPLETTIKGVQVNAKSIQESLVNGEFPKLNNVLNTDAKLVFHASNLGGNEVLLDGFKQAFASNVEPTIVAAEMVSVFGSEFTEHYLAKPYYAFYPTANSPGRVDLSKQFKRNYKHAEIDWLSAMNNPTERYQGDIYSYKFNIPLYYEFDFNEDEEVPNFKNISELRAWMLDHDEISKDLAVLGIPIDKFRLYETVRGEKLIIKGKVTVVCVMEPVMSPAYPSEYMIPSIDNLRLYNNL